ncbi:hypothetical protein T10_887 [Trichinella papuae]|uniref:Uncharacterized protein n=1 Tax=Trichinella papuae TaxID=268474 RepID=A0A0V1MSE6_9BILA|nr:hypothetical protein T10_887 [Trichinella papuae]
MTEFEFLSRDYQLPVYKHGAIACTLWGLLVGGRCGGHPNDLCHQTAYICRSIFYANAHTYLSVKLTLCYCSAFQLRNLISAKFLEWDFDVGEQIVVLFFVLSKQARLRFETEFYVRFATKKNLQIPTAGERRQLCRTRTNELPKARSRDRITEDVVPKFVNWAAANNCLSNAVFTTGNANARVWVPKC